MTHVKVEPVLDDAKYRITKVDLAEILGIPVPKGAQVSVKDLGRSFQFHISMPYVPEVDPY